MGASRPPFRAPQALPDQPQLDAGAFSAARKQYVQRWGYTIPATEGPPAGAAARVPVWSSRAGWLGQVKDLATSRVICRRFRVAPDTVVRVARAMAGYADTATGRGCRPTNARMVASSLCSERTVRRARQVLRYFELIALVQAGRSRLTRCERLEAWRRGSSHRALAAEFALSSPRRACVRAGSYPQSGPGFVERGRPPRGVGESRFTHLSKMVSWEERPKENAPRCARDSKTRSPARSRPARPGEVAARRLIRDVQTHAVWLSHASPRRLTSLHRFARHGWTWRDVLETIEHVIKARGVTFPAKVENPPAYLAWLLREVDEQVPPHVIYEAQRDEELARRRWIDALRTAPDCPHGNPGGAIPHPATGHRSCPWCRRELQEPAQLAARA